MEPCKRTCTAMKDHTIYIAGYFPEVQIFPSGEHSALAKIF